MIGLEILDLTPEIGGHKDVTSFLSSQVHLKLMIGCEGS